MLHNLIKLLLTSAVAAAGFFPDEVALRVSNVFQEDAAVLRDTVVFYPATAEAADSWELLLMDAADRLVQRFSGAGPCPRSIAWFGVSADGTVVRDGFYGARLKVSSNGRSLASPRESFSFMTPPELAPLTNLRLVLHEEGDRIAVRLPDLLFAVGRADLSPRAPEAIDAVVRLLKAHPSRPIYILGHTDDRGSPERNLRLSEQRARTVYAFLLSRGLSPRRVRYQGVGSARPLMDNRTAAGRSQNRRVEIWLSKDRAVTG
jgi:outer membrane protein OmpA-like peptidoglycan-associated protein